MRRAGFAQRTVGRQLADNNLSIWQPNADRAQHRLCRRWVDGDETTGLGHAENFVNLGAGHLLILHGHRTRQQRCTRNAVTRRRDIRIDRHIEQRCQRRRHAADDGCAIALDDLPEILDDHRIAHAARRQNNHIRARDEERQAARNRRRNMKQRQAVGNRVGLAQILQDRPAETGRNLHAVGVSDELWRTGGAAGVEIRSNVITAARLAEGQRAAILRLEARCKTDNPFRQRRIGQRHLHQLDIRQQFLDLDGLLPDVQLWVRAERDENLRICRADQIGDVLRLQQEVDGDSIALRLRTPQREMRLDKTRQDVGNACACPAKAGEEVCSAGDPFEHLMICDDARNLVVRAGHQHGQRSAIRVSRSTLGKDVVDAARVVALLKRLLRFEPDDVLERRNRIVAEQRHVSPPFECCVLAQTHFLILAARYLINLTPSSFARAPACGNSHRLRVALPGIGHARPLRDQTHRCAMQFVPRADSLQEAAHVHHDDPMRGREKRLGQRIDITLDVSGIEQRLHIGCHGGAETRHRRGILRSNGPLEIFGEENQTIGVRMFQREIEKSLPYRAGIPARVPRRIERRFKVATETVERRSAHRQQDFILVGKVAISRRLAVTQRLGNLAHRNANNAMLGKELFSGAQ